ncbi:MAG TPA: hypothetical protein VJN44_07075 [Roseateles sp.]|nr:hypothetical protein [Roseateles sp.]
MNKRQEGTASLALLALALLLPAVPAQASEVVKLARLVITGQRSGAEAAAEKPKVERLPPVLIEGRRTEDGVQYAFQRRNLPKAL